MKIVAFAASTSSRSINKQLVTSVAEMAAARNNAELDVLDLNDYQLPIFSEDLEKELGQPKIATDFLARLGSADVLIISFAEHNGLYTVAYKNLFDWCSRQNDRNIFQQKPMLLLATSPGSSGAKNVLKIAVEASPFFGGDDVRASLSVPSFYDNFDTEQQVIKNSDIEQQLSQAIEQLFA